MSPGWDYATNSAIIDFINSRKPAERRQIANLLDQLVEKRAQNPEQWFYDASGRKISVVRSGRFRIHYWVDHFAKEVRVLDISLV